MLQRLPCAALTRPVSHTRLFSSTMPASEPNCNQPAQVLNGTVLAKYDVPIL